MSTTIQDVAHLLEIGVPSFPFIRPDGRVDFYTNELYDQEAINLLIGNVDRVNEFADAFLIIGRAAEIFLDFLWNNQEYGEDPGLFEDFLNFLADMRDEYPDDFKQFARDSVALNEIFLWSPAFFRSFLYMVRGDGFRLDYFFNVTLRNNPRDSYYFHLARVASREWTPEDALALDEDTRELRVSLGYPPDQSLAELTAQLGEDDAAQQILDELPLYLTDVPERVYDIGESSAYPTDVPEMVYDINEGYDDNEGVIHLSPFS